VTTNKSSSGFTLRKQRDPEKLRGFTLIELLVVLVVISILAALAAMALASALTKAQMNGTMNNERQLYLAQFQMSNDGAVTGNASSAWPGDLLAGGYLQNTSTVVDYANVLLANGYLKGADVIKLFNASGSSFRAQVSTNAGVDQLTNPNGIASLKVYPVTEVNPANTIFAVSHNYTYNSALTAAGIPYSTKGFIVIQKAGSAAIFRARQATSGGGGWTDCATFQNQVGMRPGDTQGICGGNTDPTPTFKFP